jgi:GT2 family glycosyltransferase
VKITVGVLLTCHNRKDKTLACLASFYEAIKPNNLHFEIFLVDDGSIDGTASSVAIEYPTVNLIKGTGNLFWNQGMRLAWIKALENNLNYDFFLWLNDDCFMFKDALSHLFNCFNEYKNINDKNSLIIGACKESNKSDIFSYGLRINEKIIKPNGTFQTGNMMNGNLVLIPNIIYKKIGILSNNYTHAMGDHDYGLRAIEAGFDLVLTKSYVAVCESNKNLPGWCNPNISLKKRWKLLHTPLGLNINEYKIFIKRFWPHNYLFSIVKIYFRCFFPSLYAKIKSNEIY